MDANAAKFQTDLVVISSSLVAHWYYSIPCHQISK